MLRVGVSLFISKQKCCCKVAEHMSAHNVEQLCVVHAYSTVTFSELHLFNLYYYIIKVVIKMTVLFKWTSAFALMSV